jgi:asparagine synthase (glutamine-hydrolysing)
MSGFAGVVNGDGAPVDEALLQRLAKRLAFRGLDNTTVKTVGSAGFCFTLAKTGPAPQTTDLPITLDGESWLLGDIRLDGREALRDTLHRNGQTVPDSATDEELALEAWKARGADSGRLLVGDYAFGIWELNERRLICARDVIGAKPLFYSQADGLFCFSNTLDALRLVPGLDLRLDEHFMGDFLLQGWCSDVELTVYRGIRRLRPGHLVEFQNSRVVTRRFAELPIEEPLNYRHSDEYLEQFQTLFDAAVRGRLPSGNVAFFMSGGLDSTSVAAVAAQGSDKQRIKASYKAYTVDFRPLFGDPEPQFAVLAAQRSGMPLEMIKTGDERPFAYWTDEAMRFPEPVHEPFASRHVQMCTRVFQFAPVVLSGDGGDDLLAGTGMPYARYLIGKGKFFELAKIFLVFVWRTKQLPAMGTGLRGRLRRFGTAESAVGALPPWLRSDFVVRLNLQDRLAELNRGYPKDHPLHPRGYDALSGGYWSSVLGEEDAAWLGVPLERRSPFLDTRLLRFLLRVPPVPWCMQKELLRQTMRGLLPEEVRTRRKAPILHSPFALQADRLKWSPLPLPSPHPILADLVDWTKLEATLLGSPGCQGWDDLRPVSLNSWVKAVENEGAFLYSQNRES